MNDRNNIPPDDPDAGPPPADELDGLLRTWHEQNAEAARRGRDRLMQALVDADVESTAHNQSPERKRRVDGPVVENPLAGARGSDAPTAHRPVGFSDRTRLRRILMSRLSPVAAAVLILAALITFFAPQPRGGEALADNVLMVPEGGMLNALDAHGNILGPCPLKHTDVEVEISGHFARVTLRQRFHNRYDDKIEAVYTFPMSHNGAVDRMTMTIEDRVVIGEVHERQEARRIYEAARRSGHVASLLEQERPNIFTQSVANIEPDVEVLVEISYVELIETTDGLSEFAFPMVVGPRYIPGNPAAPIKLRNPAAPPWMEPREGLVLLAPAELTILEAADNAPEGLANGLQAVLDAANPIYITDRQAWESGEGEPVRTVSQFQADYGGAAREYGALYSDGTGEIAGRRFAWNLDDVAGTGVAPDTNLVPDAGRISPRIARPETRAGHSISITVDIDTGGPGIADLECALHETLLTEHSLRHDGYANAVTIELADEIDIPNRDFVLTWRPVAEEITESAFTHTGEHGNFVTLILQPPDRVEPEDIVPRELIFVLDTSGSMSGAPIDKAKEFISKAIGAMHPDDTFNIITFSGDTHILWDEPAYALDENVAMAQEFIETREGGGGTEMLTAIEAALYQQDPEQVAAGAPDDESYRPLRIVIFFTDGFVGNDMSIVHAIRRNAATTRVFSFGVGNSVNRSLLDGMAKAGRGVAEYLLLNDDDDAKVDQLLDRIEKPVLTNIELEFGDGLTVLDMIPAVVPDLWDERPIIVHARYDEPGEGTLTIRGNAGDGRYERAVDLVLPEYEPEHDVIATLWARAKVDEVMNEDLAAAQRGAFPPELREKVVDLGETFQIMTQFTSFVAVEHSRVTIEGEPLLVPVPVELPDGVSFDGACGRQMFEFASQLAATPETIPAAVQQSYEAEDLRRQTMQAIYGAIRTRAEEAIARRAELLDAGTDPTDASVRTLEFQILKARGFLVESGHPLPVIDPPIDEAALAQDVLLEHQERWQEATATFGDALKRIRRAVLAENFGEARRLLDFARQTISLNSRYAPTPGKAEALLNVADQLEVFVKDEKRVFDEDQIRVQQEEIRGRRNDQIRLVDASKRRQTGHRRQQRSGRLDAGDPRGPRPKCPRQAGRPGARGPGAGPVHR